MIIAKVVTLKGGYQGDQKTFDKLECSIGDEFEVEAFSIGQSCSSVQLKKGGFYNTVFFDFYEDGKELNIYVDKRFSGYW